MTSMLNIYMLDSDFKFLSLKQSMKFDTESAKICLENRIVFDSRRLNGCVFCDMVVYYLIGYITFREGLSWISE